MSSLNANINKTNNIIDLAIKHTLEEYLFDLKLYFRHSLIPLDYDFEKNNFPLSRINFYRFLSKNKYIVVLLKDLSKRVILPKNQLKTFKKYYSGTVIVPKKKVK